jgi:hypothetical protein
VSWHLWVIPVLVAVLVGYRFVPPHWRYVSPGKRRAMRLALAAARRLHVTEVVWENCFIRRCDRQKCFVFLQHRYIGRPELYSVFAVWFGDDRVDNLGTWQFHWGLFLPSQPMDAYEECRAAGVAWPVGLCEWVKWSRERGRPAL